MAFRDVLAARLDMAAGWLFRQWGKVRDLNWDAVGHMSQREMLLLAWIKSMLEALESGE